MLGEGQVFSNEATILVAVFGKEFEVRQDETFLRVREVNKAGVTVIMVEQNARRCLQICDRAYVLDQGKDAHTGTGRELLNDPKMVELYLGNLAEL